MSTPDRAAEYLLVRQLRLIVTTISQNISEKTRQDYSTKYLRMKQKDLTPESAATKKGFYAYRAALLFGVAQEARQAFSQRDKSAFGSEDWKNAMAVLHRCKTVFERYPPDPERMHRDSGSKSFMWEGVKSHKIKTMTGWSGTVASKKRVLSKVRKITDWRTHLFNQITGKHKSAAALCILTGCRPSEIARGAKIELADSPKGQHLLITINGSKITANSGQPERTIRVRVDTDEARYLANQVTQSSVTVPTHPANLCAAVIKAGRLAFPHLQETITPYVLRHALASDLKAANISPDKIAQILGHQVTESQQAYGFAVCSSGGVSIDGVRASIPVRATHRHPRKHLGRPYPAPAPR